MAAPTGLSWFNISVVLALSLGCMTYGYLWSIIATTLGQPGFYAYFNLEIDPTAPGAGYTNSIIGAANGLLCAGGCFGAVFLAWMSDAHGRKLSLLVATLVTLLGCALQAGSVHIGMFLAARLISGFGGGMLITLVPIYQAEIAPPATRGFLVSQTGVVLVTGYTVAAWVGVGCFYATNKAFQWRFPLALQCLWALLLLAVIPFIPESPRWLLVKERKDESWNILCKLHGQTGEGDIFAREEFYQMYEQVQAEKVGDARKSIWQLLQKRSHRKRFFCAFLVMFAAQGSGNAVIYNYSVLLYKGLGQTGGMPLILGALYCTVAAFLNYVCAVVIDRWGRVNLFVGGLTGCILCLGIETALVAKYVGTANTSALSAAVFILFFYILFYAGCIDANTYVYCAEIWPTHLRSKGMCFSIVALYFCQLPFLEAAPTAFANIGWRFYLLFIALSAVCIPLLWIVLPETKGLSLEEINERFGDTVEVHITHITDEEKAKLDAVVQERGAAVANAFTGTEKPDVVMEESVAHHEYSSKLDRVKV